MEEAIALTWEPEPDPKKIEKIAETVDFSDSLLPVCYGAEPMDEAAKISDIMMQDEIGRDGRAMADAFRGLSADLEAMPDVRPSPVRRFLRELPVIGAFFDSAEEDARRVSSALARMDAAQAKLDSALFSVFRDHEMLDQLRVSCEKACAEITEHIEAGRMRCESERVENGDSPSLVLFEKRLQDMAAARMAALQTVLQLRLLQHNGQELANRMQSGIYALIPSWKAMATSMLAAARQRNEAVLSAEAAKAAGIALGDVKGRYAAAAAANDLDRLEAARMELLEKVDEALGMAEQAEKILEE